MSFPNLAGVSAGQATRVTTEELRIAGMTILPLGRPLMGEVKSEVVGAFFPGQYIVTLVRLWCYWSALITPALPRDLAILLDSTPGDFLPARYSGKGSRLGDVVRANGCAGGERPTAEVAMWHIDTLGGLCGLHTRLRELIWWEQVAGSR